MMRNKLNDDSGITLVELLAVLALMSVVIMLGGAVHMFGQTQFRAQSESAYQNNDLSYAMTVMSSDLRKIPLSEVENKISLNGNINGTLYLIDIDGGPTYYYSDNELIRNTEVLVEDLKANPTIQFGENGDIKDRIEINFNEINSEAGINDKNYRTTIYFRGEP